MGNNSTKQQIKDRPKKNVHWKSAEPPSSPGKPVLVQSIDVTPDVITLQWDQPRTDGGSPIIGYLVEHRRTGSPHWVRATPALIPYSELSLSGLEPGWRYQFRVSAENAVGPSEYSELSDPLTVTLQRNAVVPPRFLAELHDTIAMENEKVEFQVQAIGTPSPQINWFKDGFEIFSSRRTKIINEMNTSTLIIHQAALTDEGEIKCSATNRAGHVVTRAQLKLEAPPKIRLPRQYEDGLLIEAEEIIRLKVGLAGRPAPTVIWTHNGEQIRNGMLPRYELITTDKNSSLKITNSKRSDRGEYHLCAINKIGEDNASFLVTVTAKPSPPGKVMITMSLGKSVTLSWQAPEDDGGCKIGNYIIEYFRIGWNVWLKALTTRQLTATINDLIEGSEYKFRVKAENPYGLSEPSNESNVLFVPDPKRGIHSSNDENSFEFIHKITDHSLLTTPSIMPRHKKPTNTIFGSSKHSLDLEQEQVNKIDKQEQTSKSPSGQDRIGKIIAQPQSRQKTQVAPIIQLSPNVYDGEKFAREMSYGTSDDIFNRRKDFKQTKSIPKYYDEDNDRYPIMDDGRSPDSSLMNENRKQQIDLQIQKQQTTGISSDSDNYNSDSVRRPLTGKLTLSPLSDRRNVNLETPRESGDEVHTSNEFVLVLYDDDNNNRKRNQQANKENNSFELELEDSIIPPPISLSAPELGAEPPLPPMIRRSVSSTELLYERAMARFYQAVELEEANENARRMSIQSQQQHQQQLQNDIPSQASQPTITESIVQKRRLSDIDRQSSFERKNMLRKRLSSDITPVALNDIHKELEKNEKLNRFIKQNSDDIDEENKIQTFLSLQKDEQSFEVDNKNDKYEEEYDNDEENDIDEYGEEEEEEEEEDDDENLKSENFTADYTDSTASSSSLDSIEAFKKAVLNSPRLSLTTSPTSSHVPSPSPQPLTEDELDTYNHSKSQQSRERTLSPYRTPEPNQSTIVLTKPLPLPNPDFVPKPILKRPSIDNNSNGSTSPATFTNTAITATENECKIKKKTIGKKKQSTKNNKTERKSLLHMFERNKKQSTSAESNLNKNNNNNNTKCDDNDSMNKSDRKIKAELEKKKSMENRQNSLEENQVVIEYYSDIVKEAANHRRPPNKVPLYMSSEELKKAAEKAEQEDRLLNLQNNSNVSPSREYIQREDELQYEDNNNNNNNNSMKSDSIGNISTIPNNKILEKTTHSNSKTCYSMELLPGISKEEVNVIVTKSTTKTKIIDDMISTKEKQTQQHDDLYKKSSNENIINSSDNNIHRNEHELNRKHQSVEQLGTLERGRTKNTGAIPKKRSQSGSVTRSSKPLNINSSARPTTTNPNASSLQKISTPENEANTRISSRNTSRTRMRSESKSPAVKNRSMLITSVSLPISSPAQRKIPLKKSMHVLSLSERSPSPPPSPISSASQRSQTPDQLLQEDIEIKVKSTMDYCTDLAMFFVACWLYIFKDPKLAIPILALMIYRQLGDALKDKLPKWMKRKRD